MAPRRVETFLCCREERRFSEDPTIPLQLMEIGSEYLGGVHLFPIQGIA